MLTVSKISTNTYLSKTLLLLIAAAVLLAPFVSHRALAQEDLDCNLSLQQCVNYSDSIRDQCFQRVGASSECRHTLHGRIASKRAELALGAAQAQIIDRECLINFDNFWISQLLGDTPLSMDGYDILTQLLDSCQKAPHPDFLRP